MRVTIHLDDMPEAEALLLSQGNVSMRIRSLARKALLKAREEHLLTGQVTFTESPDGAWEVRDGVELLGVARRYKRYWQIYMRRNADNIRRSTWPLLKLAIEERIRDGRVG